jgi:hypothetical protein
MTTDLDGLEQGSGEEIRWAKNVRDQLKQVAMERARQYQKWGPNTHSPTKWLAILAKEFGEAAKETCELSFSGKNSRLPALKKELIETAAVAIAFAQSLETGDA